MNVRLIALCFMDLAFGVHGNMWLVVSIYEMILIMDFKTRWPDSMLKFSALCSLDILKSSVAGTPGYCIMDVIC